MADALNVIIAISAVCVGATFLVTQAGDLFASPSGAAAAIHVRAPVLILFIPLGLLFLSVGQLFHPNLSGPWIAGLTIIHTLWLVVLIAPNRKSSGFALTRSQKSLGLAMCAVSLLACMTVLAS